MKPQNVRHGNGQCPAALLPVASIFNPKKHVYYRPMRDFCFACKRCEKSHAAACQHAPRPASGTAAAHAGERQCPSSPPALQPAARQHAACIKRVTLPPRRRRCRCRARGGCDRWACKHKVRASDAGGSASRLHARSCDMCTAWFYRDATRAGEGLCGAARWLSL